MKPLVFGKMILVFAVISAPPPTEAAFLVQDTFKDASFKGWMTQYSAALSVIDEPSLKGKSIKFSNKESFGGAIRNFERVELKSGEKLKVEFDLMVTSDCPNLGNGLRFGLIDNGKDESNSQRARVNDKGYGTGVGLGNSQFFSLTQDLGKDGAALAGKDVSPTNITTGGGDKSGEAFTSLVASKPTHFSLEISRTETAILLEAQSGKSFISAQDKDGLQTDFNAFVICTGSGSYDFAIANLTIEHTPAAATPVAK